MTDHDGCDQPQTPRDGKKPSRIARSVSAIQSYLKKRRSEKKQQTAADRAARSTARATWFIAFLTLATICVGVSQYLIFSRQLDEMRRTREDGDKSFADQLAVMQAQANAMQGQLDQMAVDQRPWLSVSNLSVDGLRVFPVGAGVLASATYKVINLGHSPAVAVFINTDLVFVGIDKFDDWTARQLCKPQPAGEERLMVTYSDAILPGQTLNINGWPSEAGSFSHSTRALEDAGRYNINADFILTGCVTYRLLGSDILHETGFAFRTQAFQLQGPQHTVVPLPIEIDQKGEVRTGPLITTPSSYGNFAN